jgi:hypothetical protein
MVPMLALPPETPSTSQVAPLLFGSSLTAAENCCDCVVATIEAARGLTATVMGWTDWKLDPPPHPATIVERANAMIKRVQRESRERTISPPRGNDRYSKGQ